MSKHPSLLHRDHSETLSTSSSSLGHTLSPVSSLVSPRDTVHSSLFLSRKCSSELLRMLASCTGLLWLGDTSIQGHAQTLAFLLWSIKIQIQNSPFQKLTDTKLTISKYSLVTLNSCQLSYCQDVEHFIIEEAVSPTSRQPLTATDQCSAPTVSFVRTHHKSELYTVQAFMSDFCSASHGQGSSIVV